MYWPRPYGYSHDLDAHDADLQQAGLYTLRPGVAAPSDDDRNRGHHAILKRNRKESEKILEQVSGEPELNIPIFTCTAHSGSAVF